MKKAFPLLIALLCSFFAANAQVVVTGEITTNTTWTKDKTYLLQGFVYVEDGATLTIEPGTVIKGDKASKGSLIVTRTGKIIASGTPNEPIVFTSNEAAPDYGDWGGVIVLGNAPTNAASGGTQGVGIIEGGVDTPEGDGLYGGTDSLSNSGTLRYVRIEYAGIAFSQNNEINGLTLGGVGAGTTIEYVQVSWANDDSFEWFGGTVNCRYLIAYKGLDDDFDADFGYAGNVQFAFSVRDPSVADVSGSNGFEVDNDASGTTTTPKTRPTFSNITVVGPSGTPDPNYKRAAHLRRNCEIGVFNSIFVGSHPVGLLIDGDATAQNALDGKLEVRNSHFYGQAELLKQSVTNVAFSTADWFNEAGKGNSSGADVSVLKLKAPFDIDRPDPRPQAGSPALGSSNFDAQRLKKFFFNPVSYCGAFGPNGDWTAGWSRYESGDNSLPAAGNEVVVSGNITNNTTWTKDKTYLLSGFVYVKNCATLTIEPGTVVKGDKATKGALIVTRCAKIVANGTAGEPIVFTGNEEMPDYGDWGGLILLGKAPTNATANGMAGEGIIEGGVDNAAGDGRYGGTDANDNSGILRYVRIEYAGIAFAQNNEINGLTMGGVGAGTTIENVQVSYANDDAFEWFGGTVNCKNLIAYRALDDDFDADFGFSGNIQFALSVRDPLVADVSGSNGFEVDNDATGSATTPKTAPTFSNVTVVGPSGTPDGNYKRAAHLRRNCEIGIFNSILLGNHPVGLLIDGDATAQNALDGKLVVKNTLVAGQAELLKKSTTNVTFDVNAWFAGGMGNQTFANAADLKLVNPFNLDDPNAAPLHDSPAYGKASFTGNARIENAWFTKVEEIGAFETGNDWTCPWAVWSGGQNNDCNVSANDFEKIASAKLFPTVAGNGSTTLEINLLEKIDLNVRVFNLSGQFFGAPVSQMLPAGEHQFQISTAELPAGFYLVQIEAGNAAKTEKLIVVK